jgi:maltooligosyltrehalose synthase
VLEAGQLDLRFEAENGSFAVWAYGTHKLPICPLHYARVLGDAHPALERLGDAFAGLPSGGRMLPNARRSCRGSSLRSRGSGRMCAPRSTPPSRR